MSSQENSGTPTDSCLSYHRAERVALVASTRVAERQEVRGYATATADTSQGCAPRDHGEMRSSMSSQNSGTPTDCRLSYQRAELHGQSVHRETRPARTGFRCM